MKEGNAISADAVFTRPHLIASEGRTTAYEGAGIVDSACGVVDGLKHGDWGNVGANLGATSLSALGAVMDPLQAVFAAGVGWLMEHVSILREPLDKLAGDPKAIEAHVQSWHNVEQRIYEATDFFVTEVNRSTAAWASQAVEAYRQQARTNAESVQALGVVAGAMSEVTMVVGGIVGAYRNTIRDIVAEVVGACISKAVQAAWVVLIPKVIADIGILVGTATRKILNLLRRLLAALRRMNKLTRKLDGVLAAIAKTGVAKKVDGRLLAANESALKGGDEAVIRAAHRVEAAGTPRGLTRYYDMVGQIGEPIGGPAGKTAIDAAVAGLSNAGDSGRQTADGLREEKPPPHPIDLPL